jgi:hypothetical protein
MTLSIRWVALVALVVGLVWIVPNGIGLAYQGDPVELLQPPKQLEPQVPLEDQVGCSDCWRGPYILSFGEQEIAPENLSKLVVELRSATDDDLILLMATAFSLADSRIRFMRRDIVCFSDEDLGGNVGHERCEFLAERDLQLIRGKPIYIFVGNIGPRNHRFTLTADWEPVIEEDVLWLTSNEPVTREIAANGFTFELEPGTVTRLFGVRVPSGAIAMAVRVRSSTPKEINVDAYMGKSLKRRENPEEKAIFALVSELGEEAFIQVRPAPGSYWLAVRNRTDKPQTVEVIATVLMDLRDLSPGQAATGQIASQTGLLPLLAQYLSTGASVLAPTQYRLTLKDEDLKGTIGLQITLSGSSSLSLYLRFGQVIEIRDGRVTADLSVIGPATEKTVVLSGMLLKPGIIYLAVAALLGTSPQNYSIKAELIKAETFGNQTIPIPLEAVWAQISDNP